MSAKELHHQPLGLHFPNSITSFYEHLALSHSTNHRDHRLESDPVALCLSLLQRLEVRSCRFASW